MRNNRRVQQPLLDTASTVNKNVCHNNEWCKTTVHPKDAGEALEPISKEDTKDVGSLRDLKTNQLNECRTVFPILSSERVYGSRVSVVLLS